jgi:hypothetical protein
MLHKKAYTSVESIREQFRSVNYYWQEFYMETIYNMCELVIGGAKQERVGGETGVRVGQSRERLLWWLRRSPVGGRAKLYGARLGYVVSE